MWWAGTDSAPTEGWSDGAASLSGTGPWSRCGEGSSDVGTSQTCSVESVEAPSSVEPCGVEESPWGGGVEGRGDALLQAPPIEGTPAGEQETTERERDRDRESQREKETEIGSVFVVSGPLHPLSLWGSLAGPLRSPSGVRSCIF